jgi:hypothetical protein
MIMRRLPAMAMTAASDITGKVAFIHVLACGESSLHRLLYVITIVSFTGMDRY